MADSNAPRALLFGISGQDGAYLAQLLLTKGYQVWGTSRAAVGSRFSALESLGVRDGVHMMSVDPSDFESTAEAIEKVSPQYVFNLAGQSSVGLSFTEPRATLNSTVATSSNVLEAVRQCAPRARVFMAGSGECFGETPDGGADESTPFRPTSPYAVAKAAVAWQTTVYREAYGLFACTGLLFNHESPLRPERFVTHKVVHSVARIARGSSERLILGDVSVKRDWGWAPDYVEAMLAILDHSVPRDYVIATGEALALSDFVEAVFAEAALDWRDHVSFDSALLRPSDARVSCGNPRRIRETLGWRAHCTGRSVARRLYASIQAPALVGQGDRC